MHDDRQEGGAPGAARRSRRARIVIWSCGGGLCGAVVGGILGLIIGTEYGGNFATDFRWGDLTGYEATGALGAILGSALGLVSVGATCGCLAASQRAETPLPPS